MTLQATTSGHAPLPQAETASPLDLAADADDLGLPGCRVICEIAIVPAVIWLRHEYIDVASDHRLAGIAEDLLGSPVEALDATVFVDGDDAIHSSFEDRRRFGFRLTEGCLPLRQCGLCIMESGPDGSHRPCQPPYGRNGNQDTHGPCQCEDSHPIHRNHPCQVR